MIMPLKFYCFSFYLIFIFITGVPASREKNNSTLTCYQCVRHGDIQCDPDELLPCPKNKDRCVTHIFKDEDTPLTIKRECGLGPCDFGDVNMNRGLGLDVCDRSKDKYFCVFCCIESGCNNSDIIHNKKHCNFVTITAITSMLFVSYFVT